jgi:sulfite reductase (ferredoxin)
MTQPLLCLPHRVREDVAGYGAQVARHERGEINAAAFRAYRVPMGVYEHREAGHYMVRARLGAGLVLAYQAERIANLAAQHGNGVLHVTTRQDIQIHDVVLAATTVVQEGLLDVGLSARGGGGNTVRNVSACPRAAFCPKAVFDVAPHAIAIAEYLLQSPRAFNLPRKYKIAFSGCGEDCAFASVNDLGFFAHERAGQTGFSAYAGGGLGAQPMPGILVEEFLAPDQIFKVAEAIERLFDRLGDRANKNQARLRYVLRRLGSDGFLAEYCKERANVENEGLADPVPEIRALPQSITGTPGESTTAAPAGFLPERDPSRLTLHVQLANGRIPATDLIQLAQLARAHGVGVLAATQQQDLLVPGLRLDDVDAVRADLARLSIVVHTHRPKIVACAGASTCKLGLCLSPALAQALEERLATNDTTRGPAVIRISGCPNACGNHLIASLGFEGRARRHSGRLMPVYEVLANGKPEEGQPVFAQRLGAVPARKIPDLVADIYAQGLSRTEDLRPLVQRYGEVPDEAPDELYTDVGGKGPFSLAGRGPGECGAGVLDVVRVDLEDAAQALAKVEHDREGSPHIHRALSATARALLPLFGLEVRKDREVFAAVSRYLIAPGWVARDTEPLLAAALDWRLGDRASLADLSDAAKAFHQRVRALFDSLDANLQFRLAPLENPQTTPVAVVTDALDLRGVACPMNFVKAKVALEKIALGDSLEILLDAGAPINNVPASLRDQGQEILAITHEGPSYRLRIQRNK